MHQTQIQSGLNIGLTLISAELSLTYLASIKVRAKEFIRDLQVWMEDILRPIGPSVKVESPGQQLPSRRPKQTQPVVSR